MKFTVFEITVLTLWRTTPSQLEEYLPTERPDTLLHLKEKVLRIFLSFFVLVKTEPSALSAHLKSSKNSQYFWLEMNLKLDLVSKIAVFRLSRRLFDSSKHLHCDFLSNLS